MHSKYYFFSLQFRVYLNIIYTIVEVMRCADPSESVELAQAQNAFFNELSKYTRLSSWFLLSLLNSWQVDLV